MNKLDQKVIEIKQRWVRTNLRHRLKEEERRCAESAGVVLTMGDRMLLRHMLIPLFDEWATSSKLDEVHSEEGVGRYLMIYHGCKLEEVRKAYQTT